MVIFKILILINNFNIKICPIPPLQMGRMGYSSKILNTGIILKMCINTNKDNVYLVYIKFIQYL